MSYQKKPSLKKFREVCETCQGVVSKICAVFGISRKCFYDWCHADEEFQAAIDEYKGKLLDECLKSARMLAIGIPKLDANKRIVGWKERPDTSMVKYLISTLGRREGFGDSLDITTNGKDIKPEPLIIEVIDSRDKVVQPSDDED